MPTTSSARFLPWFIVLTVALSLGGLAGCATKPPPLPRVIVEPPPPPPPQPEESLEIDSRRFAKIDQVAREEVGAGHVPGAVILVGHRGKIVYRKAFGQCALMPLCRPMKVDTIFDIASLTKVVATTTAVMELVDRGLIHLDKPAATYWPAFAANGKGGITIRQLLTHTSGLRAGVASRPPWSDYDGAMEAIAEDQPVRAPGTQFNYSDVNFITLGEIVHRVSHMPLNVFCKREVFEPLGMKDTSFLPSPALKPRIAPTDYQGSGLRWGVVSDPTSYRMGGVAGHAGVFATADDLALLAQMLIHGGEIQGKRILSPATVAAHDQSAAPPGHLHAARPRLGHPVAIQPGLQRRISARLFRSHRLYRHRHVDRSRLPDVYDHSHLPSASQRPRGCQTLAGQDRGGRGRGRAHGAAGAGRLSDADLDPEMTGFGASDGPDRVRPGIEVLAGTGFAPLVGKRIGVITNHTGIDASGRSTLQLLLRAPGVKVRAIFSPEHGLSGQSDEKVASGRDPATGLPIYSLYGKVTRPTAEMLRGLDALVYDIQDVGARFYTYITTMAYAMEAAAGAGLDFYVLDRPDPITASMVQGPVLDPDLKSYIGYFPLPVRYGMTAGELAHLFNKEKAIGAKLHVVAMVGYRREAWFDQTGLRWVNPSPNLRSLTQAILYPGVGMIESANVSVGRGTATPFRDHRRPLDCGRWAGPLFERTAPPRGRVRARDLHPRSQPLRPSAVRRRPV